MKSFLLTLAATVASATDLLLPLYQYPANNGAAWSPITEALTLNKALTAKIIINPNNGPGSGPKEGINDPQYVAGAKALTALPNAQLIGYVHTSLDGGATRCTVPYADITAAVKTWTSWVSAGIAIRGIFVDEAPNDDTNSACVKYMSDLTAFIRAQTAFGTKPIVVFNPGGTGSLQGYYDLQPDLIVAMETCFVVPERAGEDYDQCPKAGGYERYDHAGVGSSIDTVLLPNVGKTNAPRTAVLVHGFHDYNGAAANLSATAEVLQQLVGAVVKKDIGATFFNTAGYHTFSDGPASIGAVAGLLKAANGV